MKVYNKLPDTPWHVGYTKKDENDPRRHKARCIHNICGKCHCTVSVSFLFKCDGSAHCKTYAETEQAWNRYVEQMKTEEVKNEEVSEKRAMLYRIKKQDQARKVMTDEKERKKYNIYPKMRDCPICSGKLKDNKCQYCGFINRDLRG